MKILNLNLNNTCKRANIVLILLLSDRSGLTLCITAVLHLLMRSFHFKMFRQKHL